MKTNLKAGIGPLIILLIVAIVLAIGGGAYYASHHETYTDTQVEDSTDADVNANAEVKSDSNGGTIRDLLALGRNLICTIDQSTASSTAKGTLYISGNLMRGDFTTTMQSSGSIDSHMIRKDDTVYAWTGTQGAKMTFNSVTNPPAGSKSSVNLDQKLNYDCSSWSSDSEKFDLPGDVKFTDLSAMMNTEMKADATTGNAGANVSGNAGAPMSAQCKACASITDSTAKAQCLSAMHC